MNKHHPKWVEFFETCLYVIKYRQGKENVVVNALSQRYALSTMIIAKLLRFKLIKDLYSIDPNFSNVFQTCEKVAMDKHEGYLFRGKWLCVSCCSLRELIVKEGRIDGIKKTLDIFSPTFLLATHETRY